MKPKFFLLALFLIALVSCHNRHNSEEIASYSYSAEVKLSKVLFDRIGNWVAQDQECYSFIAMYNDDDELIFAKPVKAKVLVITEKAIKMKALETVTLAPKHDCMKLGIEKGDTWWENDGDLFRTQEEALAYINALLKTPQIKTDGQYKVN